MERLIGTIQPYAWGSRTAIPELLGVPADGRPQAELWLGAHPAGPSMVAERSLLDLIEAAPTEVLGRQPYQEFGPRLSFLLKVLAAARPLSLQAHPTRGQAARRFADENAAGIPLTAPERLYRDDWPKPELLYALNDVEALYGFRDPTVTHMLFSRLRVSSVSRLVEPLSAGTREGVRVTFARLLRLPEDQRQVIAEVVAAAADTDVEDPAVELFTRTAVELDRYFPGDPGVLAALLMNRIRLTPGEAIFVPPGTLHAHLRGMAVEIMANSDNVLRGGLTPKHVAIDELLAVLDFSPSRPELVTAAIEAPAVRRFQTPVPEFTLWRCGLDGESVTAPAAGAGRVLLVTQGHVRLHDSSQDIQLVRGEAAFAHPDDALTLTGQGTIFVAAPGLS